MSGAALDPRLANARVAPKKAFQFSWSDPRFRNLVWQVVILGTIALIVWYLVHNTRENLAARTIATGFAFLGQTTNIPISESLIPWTPSISTYGDALLIGILNTLKTAVVGVVLTTILGVVVGIGRLSNNWLVSRIAATYVEILRDLPLLLQLLFWYGLMKALPGVASALQPVPGVYLSNRGFKMPWIEWQPAHTWAVAAFLVGIVGATLWSRAATRRQEATGVRPAVWPVTLLLLIGLPVLAWVVAGAPWTVDWPTRRGRFGIDGGLTLSPEYAATTIALVVYTSAYVAEIVRTGILAVPTGQWEAAGALGLRRSRVLNKVVLPQALRVIVPPMTSQYLNLTKNSSLAVVIGYQEVFSITGTTQNQTGQAIEAVFIVMLVYLSISLSISGFMNWYNARIALVER